MTAWKLAFASLLLLSSMALAEPRAFKLGILSNVPEATGAEASWNFNRYLAVQGTYSWSLPIHVDLGVSSKKLVSEGDFSISSPYLDIPFAIDYGPQWSVGALVFPFGGTFHMGLAGAHRRVTIHGHVASPVHFRDKDSDVESNSVFDVDVRTKTDQDLLRAHIGQRFVWGHVYIGWYLGAVQPLSGRTKVETQVKIRNPNASEGEGSEADNLEEARAAQESILRDQATALLHRFEKQTLPLLGLEIGWAF